MGNDPDLIDELASFFDDLLDEVLGTTGGVTVGGACSISTGSGGDSISIGIPKLNR